MKEKYVALFLEEAQEHLESMTGSILALEKSPGGNAIHDFFRAAHTLKGMAATMGFSPLETLCHAMEDVMDEVRQKKRKVSSQMLDLIFSSCDLLEQGLQEIKEGKNPSETIGMVDQLHAFLKKGKVKVAPQKKSIKKISAEQGPVQKIESVRIKVEKLDTLLDLAEQLLVHKMKIKKLVHNIEKDTKTVGTLKLAVNHLDRLVSDVQYQVLEMHMMPLAIVFQHFPRMIRDLARKEGKSINLVIEGEDIELERAILNQIGEPLLHLIRNSIAHGIEKPEIRQKEKKNREGTILLKAERKKGSVLITVQDDGAGLPYKQIHKKAIEKGLLKANEQVTLKQLDDVILSASLSTSTKATLVSGRGVGMGVVKRKVEELSGTIKLSSTQKKGTTFTLELPLTLAIIKAMLIKVEKETFAIPLFDVVRSMPKPKHSKKHIRVGKENIPLISLKEYFGLSGNEGDIVVIVQKENELVGLVVDDLLDEHEIIIKPLHELLKQSKRFSGATILEDGSVALIMDIAQILHEKKNVQGSYA